MKKILLVILTFILCGCDNKKYFICESKITNKIQEYELIGTYKIYYENDFVTKIEEEEIYVSKNNETINYLYEYKNLDYNNLNNLYNGISHIVKKETTKVEFKSVFDFSKINIEKMLINKYLNKDYVVSNKLTTSGSKYIYESKGAICE